MQRQTIQTNGLQTISWRNDAIIDWANSGKQYFTNGQTKEIGSYYMAFPFDSSVTSDDGIYAVLYQKLGTKGLLLKNGKTLREINRSFYHADVYEYPVAFVRAKNGTTYIIHCPNEYCQIDFEEVETGNIVTNHPLRKPSDFFHSRFEISPDNNTLISKGWAWHPVDFVELFDIEECLKNPLLLDKSRLIPDVDAPICTASFINNDLLLIGSANDSEAFDETPTEKLKPGQIAIWDIKTNSVFGVITPEFTIGGFLTAIDDNFAWDLYDYPKIVNYKTGMTVDKIEDIQTGKQVSSIIHHLENLPKIAFNKKTNQLAILIKDQLEILTR